MNLNTRAKRASLPSRSKPAVLRVPSPDCHPSTSCGPRVIQSTVTISKSNKNQLRTYRQNIIEKRASRSPPGRVYAEIELTNMSTVQ
eukprot:2038058-Amphidinium_carterae.1